MPELHVDDAHAAQLGDAVAERGRHQADLPVQTLGEHDAKAELRDLARAAGLGHLAVDAHALGHAGEEFVGDGLVHADQVFLLVVVFRAQDLVDDVAIAGEQDQPFGILVQPADREDPLRVVDEIHDVAGHALVGGAGDADRLVQRDVDRLLRRRRGGQHARPDDLAIHAHLVAVQRLGTGADHLAVDAHAAGEQPLVGFAARTQAGFADVLVYAHKAGNREWGIGNRESVRLGEVALIGFRMVFGHWARRVAHVLQLLPILDSLFPILSSSAPRRA